MPLVYTKEEIKEYLSNRGFDVNDEEVIKKFVHDLKKLVKFEDRQRRRMNLGHDPQETTLDSSGHTSNNLTPSHSDKKIKGRSGRGRKPDSGNGNNSDDDLEKIHDPPNRHVEPLRASPKKSQKKKPDNVARKPLSKIPDIVIDEVESDDESRARDPKKYNSVKSGPDKERRRMNLGHDPQETTVDSPGHTSNNLRNPENLHPEKGGTNESKALEPKKYNSVKSGPDKENKGNYDDTDEIMYVLGDILGDKDQDGRSSSDSESRMKIPGPSKAEKRDPVKLYYYYKKFWDKQNFPGDHRHMKLRWNVRAETVGNYPCIDGRPVKYLR